jgi:hypothetical protein
MVAAKKEEMITSCQEVWMVGWEANVRLVVALIKEFVVHVGCERKKDKLAWWFLLSARGWI